MTARIVSSMTAIMLLCAVTTRAADSDVASAPAAAEPAASQPANVSATDDEVTQVVANDVSSKPRVRYLMEEISRTNITAPVDEGGDAAALLEAAIRQIEAIELTPEDFSSEPEPLPEPVLSQPIVQAEVAPPPVRISADELRRLAPELLARLKELPAGVVSDPIALGDTLYLAGNSEEAMIFYNMAAMTELLDEDAAWVLLQTAHCQAITDPAAAAKTYAKFQTEYPDSALSDVARARSEMQKWYDENQPGALIESISQMSDVPIAPPAEQTSADIPADGDGAAGEPTPGGPSDQGAPQETGEASPAS